MGKKPEPPKCPKCGREMRYHEGDDETVDGDLVAYAYWYCGKDRCDGIIHDYEDEFVEPDDDAARAD